MLFEILLEISLEIRIQIYFIRILYFFFVLLGKIVFLFFIRSTDLFFLISIQIKLYRIRKNTGIRWIQSRA